jgi:hypothetical protein
MKSVVALLAGALVACGTSNTGKPIANDKCERAFVRMLPVLQRITARNPRREIEACREAALHDPAREAWVDCILSIPSGHISVETIQDCQGKDRQARGGSTSSTTSSSPPPASSSTSSSETSSSEVSR